MHGNSLEGASNQSECHQANRELEGHLFLYVLGGDGGPHHMNSEYLSSTS